jgi:predicted nuclease of predicted toxin-antitoxin system
MNGFLFDENLPTKIRFTPSLPVIHVSILGESLSDTLIWKYAKDKGLAIVTKDADFSDRLMVDLFPPKVVHLRFGNMRKKEFHLFLENVWTEIEALVITHKLINVYLDRIEAFSHLSDRRM